MPPPSRMSALPEKPRPATSKSGWSSLTIHEQAEPGHEGARQAELAGALALLGRQPAREDGDEDDVVDAEDDLESGQGRKAEPDLG